MFEKIKNFFKELSKDFSFDKKYESKLEYFYNSTTVFKETEFIKLDSIDKIISNELYNLIQPEYKIVFVDVPVFYVNNDGTVSNEDPVLNNLKLKELISRKIYSESKLLFQSLPVINISDVCKIAAKEMFLNLKKDIQNNKIIYIKDDGFRSIYSKTSEDIIIRSFTLRYSV